MNGKEYLEQVKEMHYLINNKSDEILKLRELSVKVSSCLEGERVQGSRDNEKNAHRITSYVTKEIELEELEKKYYELCDEVNEVIYKINDIDVRNVLFKKYIMFENKDTISKELHFSVRWVEKLDRKGINEVEMIIHDENHGRVRNKSQDFVKVRECSQ